MSHTLRKMQATRQVPGEPRRRWFTSSSMDLITWHGDAVGFQPCYDKGRAEKAVTWAPAASGISAMSVDDGESDPSRHKATPILVPDGAPDLEAIRARFLEASAELPPGIVQAIAARLADAPPR